MYPWPRTHRPHASKPARMPDTNWLGSSSPTNVSVVTPHRPLQWSDVTMSVTKYALAIPIKSAGADGGWTCIPPPLRKALSLGLWSFPVFSFAVNSWGRGLGRDMADYFELTSIFNIGWNVSKLNINLLWNILISVARPSQLCVVKCLCFDLNYINYWTVTCVCLFVFYLWIVKRSSLEMHVKNGHAIYFCAIFLFWLELYVCLWSSGFQDLFGTKKSWLLSPEIWFEVNLV